MRIIKTSLLKAQKNINMRKINYIYLITSSYLQKLVLFILVFCVNIIFTQVCAAPIVNPSSETDYYVINISSGKYLTNSGQWAKHTDFVENGDLQKFKFILIDAATNAYMIMCVSSNETMHQSGGYDTKFGTESSNWILEAYNSNILIKIPNTAYHLGIDATGDGVYYNKTWSTSTRLQWKLVSTTDLDKTFLEAAILDALTIKSNAVIGTVQGYPQSDYDIFALAITEAQQKLNSSTTQAELNNAVVALRTAISTFQSKYIKFVPAVDKYYIIKYGYDLALSSGLDGKTKLVTENPQDSLQRLRFELFDEAKGWYRILNMKDQALDQIYNNEWDLIWEKINPGSQYNGYLFTIEPSDQIYILIKSVKTGKYLGVDSAVDGAGVWSNKSTNNLWRISEVPEMETSISTIPTSDFKIIISNRELRVFSEKQVRLSVFNLNGILIHESYSATNSIKLNKGLYMVKINGITQKVLIQ